MKRTKIGSVIASSALITGLVLAVGHSQPTGASMSIAPAKVSGQGVIISSTNVFEIDLIVVNPPADLGTATLAATGTLAGKTFTVNTLELVNSKGANKGIRIRAVLNAAVADNALPQAVAKFPIGDDELTVTITNAPTPAIIPYVVTD